MSSITDIISSAAASNPLVGGVVAGASVESGILATLSPSTSTGSDLTSLVAAANSAAALSPAATHTPSSDLADAITAASAAAVSPFQSPAVLAITSEAGTAAALLNGLGASFDATA